MNLSEMVSSNRIDMLLESCGYLVLVTFISKKTARCKTPKPSSTSILLAVQIYVIAGPMSHLNFRVSTTKSTLIFIL